LSPLQVNLLECLLNFHNNFLFETQACVVIADTTLDHKPANMNHITSKLTPQSSPFFTAVQEGKLDEVKNQIEQQKISIDASGMFDQHVIKNSVSYYYKIIYWF
jgi:hypothetical protein